MATSGYCMASAAAPAIATHASCVTSLSSSVPSIKRLRWAGHHLFLNNALTKWPSCHNLFCALWDIPSHASRAMRYPSPPPASNPQPHQDQKKHPLLLNCGEVGHFLCKLPIWHLFF